MSGAGGAGGAGGGSEMEEELPGEAAAPRAGTVRRVDPLLLLREETIAKRKVRSQDDDLDFSGFRVHRDKLCGFRLSPAEPCIDIGSVWYMLKCVSADKPYTAEFTRKRGFKYIGIAHRSDLCDYVEGKSDTCRGLVKEVVEGLKRPRPVEPSGPLVRQRRSSTGQAVAGNSADAGAAGASQPAPSGHGFKIADLCYADVQARAIPVKDLDVLVRCPGKPIPNADMILKIAQEEVNNYASRRRHDASRDGGIRTKKPLIQELEGYLAKDSKAYPIILVPCNKSAPVNLLNVAKFLQDGEFERADLEHQKFFESTRVDYAEVGRNIDGRMWTFEVRDTAKNFTKNQWKRVVAVITDASEWQFVGWPFRDIVDLFTTIKGVYFNPVNVLTPLHVRSWAVSILDLQMLQYQHRYAELRDTFWVEVTAWLKSYRLPKFSNDHIMDKVVVGLDRPLPVL